MPGLIVNGLNLSKWFHSERVAWSTHSALSFWVGEIRVSPVDQVAIRCTTRKLIDSATMAAWVSVASSGLVQFHPTPSARLADQVPTPSRPSRDTLGSYVVTPTVAPCGTPSTKRTSAPPDCALYRSRRVRGVASDANDISIRESA